MLEESSSLPIDKWRYMSINPFPPNATYMHREWVSIGSDNAII